MLATQLEFHPRNPQPSRRMLNCMRMTVLASGSKGNRTVIASAQHPHPGRRRPLLPRTPPAHGARRRRPRRARPPSSSPTSTRTTSPASPSWPAGCNIPVYLTEPTHRAWVRMLTPAHHHDLRPVARSRSRRRRKPAPQPPPQPSPIPLTSLLPAMLRPPSPMLAASAAPPAPRS